MVVAILLWSVSLPAAPLQNPEFCSPGLEQTPEQLAKIEAAILKEPESTRRMAALLQQINQKADPMNNPFRSMEQVAKLREIIARTTDVGQLFNLKMQLVLNLLQIGQNEDALQVNEALLAELRQYASEDNSDLWRLLGQLMTRFAICEWASKPIACSTTTAIHVSFRFRVAACTSCSAARGMPSCFSRNCWENFRAICGRAGC